MFQRHTTPRPPISATQVTLVIGGSFLLGLLALVGH